MTAFLLAVLSWFAIKFAIYKGITEKNQPLTHRKVMVLKSPDDPRATKVEPPYVNLVLQASKELSDDDDVEVFVDITNVPQDVNSVFKPVLVRGPAIEKIIKIEPGYFARVVRVSPPDTSSTNAFKKQ